MGQIISIILNMIRGHLNLPTPTPGNISFESINDLINESDISSESINNLFNESDISSESIDQLINESQELIANIETSVPQITSVPEISVPEISVPEISVPQIETFTGNTDNLFKTRTTKMSKKIFKRNVNKNILGPKASSI
tara:strand:+ start:439 stop:861 length:423 start_codon:yes stop_codon:yes gene_type:complete